jgi:hypothetical protein
VTIHIERNPVSEIHGGEKPGFSEFFGRVTIHIERNPVSEIHGARNPVSTSF